MAETAVNLVIDKLIPLIRDEVKLLKGVRGEISFIKNQLELIQAYIKDADIKAEIAEPWSLVKVWVKQVREVAYRMQDIMDEYLYKIEKSGQKHHGVFGFFQKSGNLIRTVMYRHEMSDEIADIKETLVRLNQAKETFGLNPNPSSSPHQWVKHANGCSVIREVMQSVIFMDEACLVGFDHTKGLLNGWLSNGETRRTVISVVGEGGLGKTTVVNNLYKKQKDERSFDCYAWITVSRSLKAEDLLKAMMQSLYEYDNNNNSAKELDDIKDVDSLTTKLKQYLQGRRYMIVFDDVWNIDFWGVVEFALPDDNNKNRIIITTRDRGVADFCTRSALSYIHELKPLPPHDALKLLYLKAFQSDYDDACPEELKGLSQEFVNKCDGVPLAIVAMAGLLSTKKKLVSEWQRVLHSLHSKLASDLHLRGYYQVLLESYNDLPYHLKLCLLNFGLFPQGYSISCNKLINLWRIEGFVKKNVNDYQMTLEEVAEEYLEELVRRNLVKISMFYPYGRVRRCKVHDLMHDFILKKCEELNFCQVKKSEEFEFHPFTRRLSIHSYAHSSKSPADFGRVRSCFVFNLKELTNPMAESLLSSFKLLVALDMEDSPLQCLPEAVGNLFYLKYLNLRSTKIKTVPKFIGKLQNLEILDLKNSQVRELPLEINKLVKLRQLIATSLVLNEGKIRTLQSLQKLSNVDVSDNGDSVINELKNLKEMRVLSIVGLKTHQGKLLCSAIENMNHLCSLSIEAANEDEVIDLESLNDPPHNLQRLYLKSRLEKLPKWIVKLRNLVKLRLSWSGLKEDPFLVLKDLPELLELSIAKSYEGEELNFKDGWFRKLKILEIANMQGLRRLKIEKGSMPLLQEMTLKQCTEIVEMPSEIHSLENLKMLHLVEMPDEIVNNVRMKEGRRYDKIKEITCVTCFKRQLSRRGLVNL